LSVWRKKAAELFDIPFGTNQHRTIYDVFQTLLQLVKEAHRLGDEEQLKNIYEYAGWCSSQRAKHLWNAAGVSFYEHLVDDKLTCQAIPYWITPEIFSKVKSLFKWRMKDDKAYQELVEEFNRVNGTSIEYKAE